MNSDKKKKKLPLPLEKLESLVIVQKRSVCYFNFLRVVDFILHLKNIYFHVLYFVFCTLVHGTKTNEGMNFLMNFKKKCSLWIYKSLSSSLLLLLSLSLLL